MRIDKGETMTNTASTAIGTVRKSVTVATLVVATVLALVAGIVAGAVSMHAVDVARTPYVQAEMLVIRPGFDGALCAQLQDNNGDNWTALVLSPPLHVRGDAVVYDNGDGRAHVVASDGDPVVASGLLSDESSGSTKEGCTFNDGKLIVAEFGLSRVPHSN
jgi:hypothetical protein